MLVVTAGADRSTVEQSLRNGTKGYIFKAFNPGTVMDTSPNYASSALLPKLKDIARWRQWR